MIRREFLTAEEAAQMLGVAAPIVRKLARSGEIPAYKFGKLWRFDPKELREHCTNGYPRG